MRKEIRSCLPLFLCLPALVFGGCAGRRSEMAAHLESVVHVLEHGEEPDFLELLREARRNYEVIDDYTTHFTKQQRIRGKLLPEEEIFMKFRKPHQVYMRWTGKVDRGQEVLYAKGKYNDRMIAHRGGFILSHIIVALDPDGRRAMKKNLRPVTCAGIGYLIGSLIEVSERAASNNNMRVEYLGVVDLPDGEAHKFERYIDEEEGYPCYRAVVYLDKETYFPVIYEAYDSMGNMLERYTYSRVKTDQGLDEEDFDRHNREYRFRFF